MRELTELTEDELFARFLAHRAEDVWAELVLRSWDRIQTHIAVFRFPGGSAIPAYDQGEAAGDAWRRARGMNFRGTTVEELRAALKTVAWNACMDWGRRRLAYDRHIHGSLDAPVFDDEGREAGSRYDGVIADRSREREQMAAEAAEDEELRTSQIARLRRAIEQVSNESYREVLHLSFVEKVDAAEIASRLDITLDNVYQRRSRGVRKLEVILRDDAS